MSYMCEIEIPVSFGERLVKGWLKSITYDGDRVFLTEQISYCVDGMSGLTSKSYELTKINLCDVCKKCIADCNSKNIKFGNGKGNDNVYLCDAFEWKEGR